MSEVLVVEDEEIIRGSLRRLLEREGYRVYEAASIPEAEETVDLSQLDLIIADLRLPGPPGTEIINKAKGVPVLIMTSYASVRSAVEAMKLGAVDYIAKPFDHEEMQLTVKRILQQDALKRQNTVLKDEISIRYPVGGMIGRCQAMQEVFNHIHKVAPTNTTVLIQGESGTGKELVARALHDQSMRSHAPIITVNCAAIPETLIESELFGHEKGAFTGAVDTHRGLIEAADGGTLFLDEIGELPVEAQARLLRVLQEGEIRRVGSTQSRQVDIRLIAATHRNLQEQVEKGLFRSDLYFRLHVMEINLPPLRSRGDDVLELAEMLLEKSCKRLNKAAMSFTDRALERLKEYHWPGNVRELENIIERSVILSEGDSITASLLAIPGETATTKVNGDMTNLSLDDYFVEFVLSNEQEMTETELARQLGISRKTLWEKRQRLNIPRNREQR